MKNSDFQELDPDIPKGVVKDSTLFEIAKKLSTQGYLIEQISVETGLSMADIKQLLD